MKKTAAQLVKARVRRNVREIDPGEVAAILNEISEIKTRIPGIGNKIWVRLLSGGYWSQSLDSFVMMELGKRAGWRK